MWNDHRKKQLFLYSAYCIFINLDTNSKEFNFQKNQLSNIKQ